jgi:hypothetical protein
MGKVLMSEEERFIFLNASNKPMYDSIISPCQNAQIPLTPVYTLL